MSDLPSRREVLKLVAGVSSIAGSVSICAAGQVDPRSKTFDLVFEGGGIKGVALAGALEEFEKAGFGYRRLIGTSVGAIMATLLGAGYRPGRLVELLTAREDGGRHLFAAFLQPLEPIPAPVLNPDETPKTIVDVVKRKAFELAWDVAYHGLLKGCVVFEPVGKTHPEFSTERMRDHLGRGLSLLSTGAAADDRPFLDWMAERLKEAGFDDPDITLADFHTKSAAARGIQLSMVATDVSAKRSLVLNHRTAPGVPVRWAVRMSMGIPLVWAEVQWKPEWGTYRGAPMIDEQGGHRVVDGGVLSNFPLKYLLEEKHLAEGGVLGPFRNDVRVSKLGLLLDESLEVPGAEPREEKRQFAEKLVAYQSVSRLIDTMTGAWDQDVLDDPQLKPFICRIPVKGYDTLDFDTDADRMELLIKSGREALQAYLKSST